MNFAIWEAINCVYKIKLSAWFYIWYISIDVNVSDGIPDSKIHGANMGPTWVLSAPDGPHVGPVNLVTRDVITRLKFKSYQWNIHVSCVADKQIL